MAVITMAFSDLVKRLQSDYKELDFVVDDVFYWSAKQKTVFYSQSSMQNAPQLLHEVAHGILGHHTYTRDINLLRLERAAWNKALEIAEHYNVEITDEIVEDALDSYRNWLHARSTCPRCTKTGIQTSTNLYRCVVCDQTWHTNDARTCGLKRTKV